MSKTWLAVATALVLLAVSSALLVGRYVILGDDLEGPLAAPSWPVTLVAVGEMAAADSTLTLHLPLDFRQQHVFDEAFQSDRLLHRVRRSKDPQRRHVVWGRQLGERGPAKFRVSYSFRSETGTLRPTPAMRRRTREVDAAPAPGEAIKPAPRIESDHREVADTARTLVAEGMNRLDQVRAFYDHVSALGDEPALLGSGSAVECLRNQSGDATGKSRLLVALCRSRGIPARLVTGLVLEEHRSQEPHRWVEAWVNDHWLPACPAYRHFGTRRFPRNYLVLQVGEEELLRGHKVNNLRFGFTVAEPSYPADSAHPPSAAKAFFRSFSLHGLRPAEQQLVRLLLLMPLAALIVSVFRTVVGFPTYGTFAPALMGLAFLDLRGLPWGLGFFLVVILAGWCLRRVLDRYHLLLVPRVSALLTLIVVLLVAGIVVAHHHGEPVTYYTSLFPLVILTHLVERFWTVEAEDSTTAAFQTLLGTFIVAITISLCLSPPAVRSWMFNFPETVGIVLAMLFLLGRYTGYRVSELYRFEDLIREEKGTGEKHDLAGALAAAEGPGHPGHERPQRPVHP